MHRGGGRYSRLPSAARAAIGRPRPGYPPSAGERAPISDMWFSHRRRSAVCEKTRGAYGASRGELDSRCGLAARLYRGDRVARGKRFEEINGPSDASYVVVQPPIKSRRPSRSLYIYQRALFWTLVLLLAYTLWLCATTSLTPRSWCVTCKVTLHWPPKLTHKVTNGDIGPGQ